MVIIIVIIIIIIIMMMIIIIIILKACNIAMTINMAQPQTLAPQVLANDKWQMLGSILQLRYLDVSRTAIFQDDSLGGSL